MPSFKRPRWLRFRPRNNHIEDTVDPFLVAEHELQRRLPRRPRVDRLKKHIEQFRHEAENGGTAANWLAYLFVQGPRASLAQQKMDKHPRGYHNKSARLFELIDFNDAFVAAVLALDDAGRQVFEERAKQSIDRFCKRTNVPCFTNEQWRAISRGLSRELALYQAARDNGFEVYMTSRSQDALGVDMQIRDPETLRYINVDCKSPSAFRYRLEELSRERRITTKELYRADERGYTSQTNGHGQERVEVVLMSVSEEKFSEIVAFEFRDLAPMREMLNRLIREYGLEDGKWRHG